MWEIFEQERIKNVVSGLDKKSGSDAILAVSYADSVGRKKTGAQLKESDDKKIKESTKKIKELIDNFTEMKGSSNKWAGNQCLVMYKN